MWFFDIWKLSKMSDIVSLTLLDHLNISRFLIIIIFE
jgi:hypothetical protein